MKTQHTPGPWMIGMKGEHATYNANCVCDEHGTGICSVAGIPLYVTLEELVKSGNTSDAEGLANARLIAVAPELLEACKAIWEALDRWATEAEPTLEEIAALRERAKAAMAKAQGAGR